MEIELTFPSGKRVDAHFGKHVVRTDQPVELGGQDAEPAPYDLFLASLATCAGIYALGFLQSRGLPTEGLGLKQTADIDPETHLPRTIRLELTLPAGLPEKYRPALLRAVEHCRVKKSLANPPAFEIVTKA